MKGSGFAAARPAATARATRWASGQLPAVTDRFTWRMADGVAQGHGRREPETWVTRADAVHGTHGGEARTATWTWTSSR